MFSFVLVLQINWLHVVFINKWSLSEINLIIIKVDVWHVAQKWVEGWQQNYHKKTQKTEN